MIRLRLFLLQATMSFVVAHEGMIGAQTSEQLANDLGAQAFVVFQRYCTACHQPPTPEGGLDLTNYSAFVRGGESGKVWNPQQPELGLIWKRLMATDESRMPPATAPTLPANQREILLRWLQEKAPAPQTSVPTVRRRLPPVSPSVTTPIPILAMAIDSQGRWLALGRSNGISIHRLNETGSVVSPPSTQFTSTTGSIHAVLFIPGTDYLCSGSGEPGNYGELTLWDIPKERMLIRWRGHHDAILSLSCNSQGNLLASSSYDHTVIIWDLENQLRLMDNQTAPPVLHTVRVHHGAVHSVSWSPTSNLLASASSDRTVKLIDGHQGIRIDTFSQPSKEQLSVAWSTTGNLLAAAGADMRVRVWDISPTAREGTNRLEYARFAHGAPITNLVFSPSGDLLVSASEDRRVQVWETQTFTPTHLFDRLSDVPSSVIFHPSGRIIYVGCLDGRLYQFDVHSQWAQQLPPHEQLSETPPLDNQFQQQSARRFNEQEPNDVPSEAEAIVAPAEINGVLHQPGDTDHFRLSAKRGDTWIVETAAQQDGSPADTRIQILDRTGNPVLRGWLQAVRDSWINFRPIDSSQLQVRVEFWEEMDLNQYLYMNGEIGKFYRAPRGPDSGYDFYDNRGKRRGYFDTTATAHAKDEPVYIVKPLSPSARLHDNGLPRFPLYYENDDDGERELGSDSRLTFVVPEDGDYIIRISDSRGHGGPAYCYKLFVRPPRPDFSIQLQSPHIKLHRGSAQRLVFQVDRQDHFNVPIELELAHLPEGYTAPPTVLEAGHLTTWSVLCAAQTALPTDDDRWKQVQVLARAAWQGSTLVKTFQPFHKVELLAPAPSIRVSLLADDHEPGSRANILTLSPGGRSSAIIEVDRISHTGDVRFEVDNLPHGVIVDDIGLSGVLVRAGENRRQIFLSARPWVDETERWIFATAQGIGNPASVPIKLVIQRKQLAPESLSSNMP